MKGELCGEIAARIFSLIDENVSNIIALLTATWIKWVGWDVFTPFQKSKSTKCVFAYSFKVFTAFRPKQSQLAREHCNNLFFLFSDHLTLRASNSNKR